MPLLIQTDEGGHFVNQGDWFLRKTIIGMRMMLVNHLNELRMVGAMNSSRPAFHLKPKMTRDFKCTSSTRMNDNADMNLNRIYNYSWQSVDWSVQVQLDLTPYHELQSIQVHMLQENQSLPCLVDHEDEQMALQMATLSPFLYSNMDYQVCGCDSHTPSSCRTST